MYLILKYLTTNRGFLADSLPCYLKWVKEESAKHSDFQKLWEVLVMRVMSEAIWETAGSMMNQHCGKNRFLQPENFNISLRMSFAILMIFKA